MLGVCVRVGCCSPNNLSMSLHALPLSESVLISHSPAGLDFTGRAICFAPWVNEGRNDTTTLDTVGVMDIYGERISNTLISSG
jgi:hypothetical protein